MNKMKSVQLILQCVREIYKLGKEIYLSWRSWSITYADKRVRLTEVEEKKIQIAFVEVEEELLGRFSSVARFC